MDKLNKRIESLEKTIKDLVTSLRKIEDAKKKDDLYVFSNHELMKWLKDNEVNYHEEVKDTLVDIVWTNLNEWEWEYYDEEDAEEDAEEEENSESEECESESDPDFSDEESSKKSEK
jgi:hypothetical protein